MRGPCDLQVLAYEQNKKLRWRGKLWGSNLFFVGEHYFEMQPMGSDKTKLIHGERRGGGGRGGGNMQRRRRRQLHAQGGQPGIT